MVKGVDAVGLAGGTHEGLLGVLEDEAGRGESGEALAEVDGLVLLRHGGELGPHGLLRDLLEATGRDVGDLHN